MKLQFVCSLALVLVLLALADARRKRSRCKYQKGEWSECNQETNTATRELRLTGGGSRPCEEVKTQTITCDKLQAIERRRSWIVQRQQRKQMKEQLKRCNYEAGDWSECDTTTNTANRVFTLTEDNENCEENHTMTISCDKLAKIQAGMEKKRQRQERNEAIRNERRQRKEQMKEEKRRQRQERKEMRLRCKYDKGNWSECDAVNNTVSRVLTLIEGDDECEQTLDVTISCGKYERIQKWKAKHQERKNERMEQKKQRKEEISIVVENGKIIRKQRRQGCSFEVSFSECDPLTNMVTKSYTPSDEDDETCEGRSVEYSCDLHNRLMEKKNRRQERRKQRRGRN